MKGIVLAAGQGTRLLPTTRVISKQLLPVYDKPMIYYPLTTLMLAGVRDILVITTPRDREMFHGLLGDGSQWGVHVQYTVQPKPEGLAQAFILGEAFVGDDAVALALGDNIFYAPGWGRTLRTAAATGEGATVFAYSVPDPERYGVVTFDAQHRVLSVEEKPDKARSSFAVTGLYFYDNAVVNIAKNLTPSARGELEITDINRVYLGQRKLVVEVLSPEFKWFDVGTPQSLYQASVLLETVERRHGLKVGCPEEVALNCGYISHTQFERLIEPLATSEYGKYLRRLLNR